jgi:hypothetical protein
MAVKRFYNIGAYYIKSFILSVLVQVHEDTYDSQLGLMTKPHQKLILSYNKLECLSLKSNSIISKVYFQTIFKQLNLKNCDWQC